MGRVYYDSFKLCNIQIRVGDFVKLDDKYFKLVSAFQGTRSFVGKWNGGRVQLQNRGFAYVELAPLKYQEASDRFVLCAESAWNPGHIEGAPTALFDDGIACDIQKVDIDCTEALVRYTCRHYKAQPLTADQLDLITEDNPHTLTSSFALNVWPAKVNAKFVILYANDRKHRLDVHEEYTAFDSDDSDDFDESSMKQMMQDTLDWNDELESASDVLKNCDDGMGYGMTNQEDTIQVSKSVDKDNECGPKVMFEGSLLPDKILPCSHIHEAMRKIQPLLEELDQEPTLKDAVSSFQKTLLAYTVSARLEDYFSLGRPKMRRGGCLRTEYATKVGFERYKSPLQQLACEHVSHRQDTVMIAPCGSGKSLVFVQAALMSGKINIIIEPLNEIIKSQLRELEYLSPHLDMEQLFNNEEARSRRVPSSYDRLQMLINKTKVSTNPCRSITLLIR